MDGWTMLIAKPATISVVFLTLVFVTQLMLQKNRSTTFLRWHTLYSAFYLEHLTLSDRHSLEAQHSFQSILRKSYVCLKCDIFLVVLG